REGHRGRRELRGAVDLVAVAQRGRSGCGGGGGVGAEREKSLTSVGQTRYAEVGTRNSREVRPPREVRPCCSAFRVPSSAFYFLPSASRFANSRYAPGTPAGSCRKKLSPVYTYVPLPACATRRPPWSGGPPASCVASSGVYSPSQSCAN